MLLEPKPNCREGASHGGSQGRAPQAKNRASKTSLRQEGASASEDRKQNKVSPARRREVCGVSCHALRGCQHHDHRGCMSTNAGSLAPPHSYYCRIWGKDPGLCILNRFFSVFHTHTHTHKFKDIFLKKLKHLWNTVMSTKVTRLGSFFIDKPLMSTQKEWRGSLPKLSPLLSSPGKPKSFSDFLYLV